MIKKGQRLKLTVKKRKPSAGVGAEQLRETGYKALACAIIEQAIYDYRYLEQHGLVANGWASSDDQWPTYVDGKGCRNRQKKEDYACSGQVKELVWFLMSDYLKEMLSELAINASRKDICRALGIKRRRDDATT